MSTRKKQRRNIVLTALEVIFLCIFLFALFQAALRIPRRRLIL